jgi:hypothetical protein
MELPFEAVPEAGEAATVTVDSQQDTSISVSDATRQCQQSTADISRLTVNSRLL